MKFKIKIENIFFNMFLILPIIDSINGFINNGGNENGLSLGIIYRFTVFLICLFILYKFSILKSSFGIFIGIILFIFIPQLFHTYELVKLLILLFKLILPIVCIETYKSISSKEILSENFVEKLFDYWSIIFPSTILLPYFMGIGFNTYGSGAVGYKGFYYAQNDVGFILSILYIYSVSKFVNKITFRRIVSVILIMICSLLLGLKSNYMIIIVITAYYLVKKNRNKGSYKNKLIMILAVVIGIIGIYCVYNEQIKMIYERWIYFSSMRSFTSFMTSARSDRILPTLFYIRENHSMLYFIFGTGLSYTNANLSQFIEMDFFDIYFQLGYIGLMFILFYYFSVYFRHRKKESNKSFYNIAFLVTMVISFLAGHVLQSALSGMFLSMICCGLITNKNYLNIGHIVKNKGNGDKYE
ncbi:O-antigen ligase family protein [Clostridium tertium]